jgi:hypothetical protein
MLIYFIYGGTNSEIQNVLVGKEGVEPSRLSARDPKSTVRFNTPYIWGYLLYYSHMWRYFMHYQHFLNPGSQGLAPGWPKNGLSHIEFQPPRKSTKGCRSMTACSTFRFIKAGLAISSGKQSHYLNLRHYWVR